VRTLKDIVVVVMKMPIDNVLQLQLFNLNLYADRVSHSSRTTFAGIPTTRVLFGTFFVTTDPAPTIAASPTITPGRIFAPALMATSPSIVGQYCCSNYAA